VITVSATVTSRNMSPTPTWPCEKRAHGDLNRPQVQRIHFSVDKWRDQIVYFIFDVFLLLKYLIWQKICMLWCY